jgi:hypothetical protein
MTRGDGKIFMSGDLDWFGEHRPINFAVLNTELGGYDSTSYPNKAHAARRAISDGAGGWYTANYSVITHIKADKTAEDLPFVFDGGGFPINAIEKVGNILYVGGNFDNINTTIVQKYAAAIDLTTKTLTSWDPKPNGYVYEIKGSGSIVYVGGDFSSIGGQTRSNIAAIDASTGLATSWNANVSALNAEYIYTIAVGVSTVYFAGGFSNVANSSQRRSNLAAVNSARGDLISFNPQPNSRISKILLDGNTLYIAGEFTQIGGASKSDLVAMDVTTGLFTNFSATTPGSFRFNPSVIELAIDGQKLFIGGVFLTVNGAERARLAVVNKTTGALEPMEEGRAMSSFVSAIAISNGKVLVGGNRFGGITGITSSLRCVAVDEATGELAKWRPQVVLQPNGYIEDFHFQNDRVYYKETIYSSSTATYETIIGAVNSTDGKAVGWSATINGRVNVWAFSGTTLYIAGEFSAVNRSAKVNFAAIDLATGNLLPYSPAQMDGQLISSLAIHNNTLYATGEFSFAEGGITYTNLASWDATTGTLKNWAPQNISNSSRIGTVTNNHVYIMGSAFRVDATTGVVDDKWKPVINGGVNAMVVQGNSVYIAGQFSPGLVRADIETGAISGWQPSMEDVEGSEGEVSALAISATKLFVGGNFGYSVGGMDRGYFGIYPLPTELIGESDSDIMVYNAVSPDGKNPILRLEFIDTLSPKNQVSIYNRWGDEVFSISDYDNKTRVFAGLGNGGSKLPAGTYFYKINLSSTGKTLTGFLALKY